MPFYGNIHIQSKYHIPIGQQCGTNHWTSCILFSAPIGCFLAVVL